ncbi:MAG: CopD family protein [Halobacteriales archaeon]
MTTPLEVTYAVHLLFAGLWAGGVVFATVGVLPSARAGSLEPEPLGTAFSRLRMLSRGSALVLFLTGGYMAGQVYTAETLTGSTNGYLVIAMVVLWLVLAALVEVGASRISDGVAEKKVRDPARSATRLYQAASVAAALLLVIGGVLSV